MKDFDRHLAELREKRAELMGLLADNRSHQIAIYKDQAETGKYDAHTPMLDVLTREENDLIQRILQTEAEYNTQAQKFPRMTEDYRAAEGFSEKCSGHYCTVIDETHRVGLHFDMTDPMPKYTAHIVTETDKVPEHITEISAGLFREAERRHPDLFKALPKPKNNQ